MPFHDWPAELTLLRHGEFDGNVARDLAEAQGLEMIDIPIRDMDVPLSARGREQAVAVGRHLLGRGGDGAPHVVYSSPYLRAADTVHIALAEAGLPDAPVVLDERLREREFGILDRLTRRGIEARYPEQAEARRFLGKFYHRPPGGESWTDVGLRVRSIVELLCRDHSGDRVLLASHQVVILMFRYVLEHLREDEILTVDRAVDVANCSLTRYRRCADGSGMELEFFNDVAHIVDLPATVTTEADPPPENA